MKDILYAYLPELSADILKATLVLEFHEKADVVHSLPIFAEAAGLSLRSFEHTLEQMKVTPKNNPLIVDFDAEKIILSPVFFQGKTIALKQHRQVQLGKYVKELTIEIVKNGRRKSATRTTIHAVGDEQVTVERITKSLGRALLEEEAYILGKCMQNYGPERVWSAFSRATGKSLIHSMSGILYGGFYGQRGKPAEPAKGFDYKEY
jgi:hypothetical protein